MKMTNEQEKQARRKFDEDIKNVDYDDVKYASKKGNTKINSMESSIPNTLLQMWEDIKIMLSLLTDYVKGNYKETPWNVIAAITGAMVYFISPIDIIPDIIPVIGYMDDAMILKFAIDFSRDDLIKYKAWKQS